MKRYLIPCSAVGNDYSADCDFVLIEVTPELADTIKKRIAAATALAHGTADICGVDFWSGWLPVYSYEIAGAIEDAHPELWEEVENGYHPELPENLELPEGSLQRIECIRMRVSPPIGNSEAYVSWVFVPKHTGLRVETDALNASMFDLEPAAT